jgi:hypothetical protein
MDVVERAQAALQGTTPGPWWVDEEIDGMRQGRKTVVKADDPTLGHSGSVQSLNRQRVVTVDQTRPHHDAKAEANVKFIAEARTLMPEMITEIERLRSLVVASGIL